MEPRVNLSEVLKRPKKFERPLLEQELYEDIINRELDITILTESGMSALEFRDYKDPSLKRRAQTISVAYNIAVKLLLSLELTGTTETYWKTSAYIKNPTELEKIRTDFFDEDFIYKTLLEATNNVDFLNIKWNQVKDNVLDKSTFLAHLADVSVTLAWLEVYYKTTFLPKETQVIDKQNETHLGLVKEVLVLLDRTLDTLKNNLVFINSEKIETLEFDKEVVSKDGSFSGTANILIDGNKLLEIKTTGKEPTQTTTVTDFEHAVGLSRLNKDINVFYIYYARFDYISAAEVSDE